MKDNREVENLRERILTLLNAGPDEESNELIDFLGRYWDTTRPQFGS